MWTGEVILKYIQLKGRETCPRNHPIGPEGSAHHWMKTPDALARADMPAKCIVVLRLMLGQSDIHIRVNANVGKQHHHG